jgi:hypothetical protein
LANTRESASSESQASTDGDTTKARERADDASIVVSVVHAPYGDLPGVISVRVPQQVIAAGRGFSFPLPAALVQAAGDGEVTVTLADGAPLPSWLRYVPASRSCVATQPPAGALPLTVIISIGSQRWNMTLSEQSER